MLPWYHRGMKATTAKATTKTAPNWLLVVAKAAAAKAAQLQAQAGQATEAGR